MPKVFRTPRVRKKFAREVVAHGNMKRAAMAIGYPKNQASSGAQRLMSDFPDVAKAVEDGLSEAARLAGVSRSWVIIKLREVVERCMQVIQVYDKFGNETGEFKFDAAGATKALELIGKHLRVFGDDASAQAQVGAAVIRLLAQEAQEGRFPAKAVVVDVQADRVPSTDGQGDPLASTRADAIPPVSNMDTPPLSTGFETPS